MISLLTRKRVSPIGVDIGARSVKLAQLSADRTRAEVSRWEFSGADQNHDESVVEALQHAYAAGSFRGREVALCLSNDDLFLQNIRVPKEDGLERRIVREAVERLPFPAGKAELRYLETADVRQAESVMREVIVMACLREKIDRRLALIDQAGFTPIGLEVEPLALARSYARQQRRSGEQDERTIIAHVGYSQTLVVIVQGDDVQFVKYIDVGGSDIDKSVGEHLHLQPTDASSLRRHDGDAGEQELAANPDSSDLTASIARAARPVYEQLAQELTKCIRYFSVTFRGAPLERVVLTGGEATEPLGKWLAERLNLHCELSDSLRGVKHRQQTDRAGNWDIAMGLALRETS